MRSIKGGGDASTSRELPAWADAEATQELPQLCDRGESQNLEFKVELPAQAHDIGKSIAAFASTNAGTILYGVADDGTIRGIGDAYDTKTRDICAQRIFNAARDIRPSVQPSLKWAVYDGKVVCVVHVERGIEAIYYSNHRPIVRRGASSRPAEPHEVEHVFRLRYGAEPKGPLLASTLEIARRMSLAIEKINERRFESLAVSDFALAMGFESAAQLEEVLVGHVPATFAFLDQFCARFAVNKEWVSSGRSAPFYPEIEHRTLPLDYLSLIEDSECDAVYAVRSTSDVGETFLVIESDPLKFWRLPDLWHVSNHVGGGGSQDLVSLYCLFRHWLTARTGEYMVLGRSVEPKLAESIWNGHTHPGVLEHMPNSHWWDDLTDLEGKWTDRKKLAKQYGKNFVAAQDIVRNMLASDRAIHRPVPNT